MEGKETKKVNDMLIDLDLIDKHLAENTKKILRDVAKEEFSNLITRALNEDFDEEDVEDGEELGGEELGDVAPTGAPEVPADDTEDPMGDVGGIPDLGGEDEVMDLTGSDDATVMSVFKELQDSDEVEVIGDEIHINVTTPGKYIIKPNGGGMSAAPKTPDFEVDLDSEVGDDVDGIDLGADAAPTDGGEGFDDSEMSSEEDEEIEFDENVVYEIVMNGINEEGAHDEHMKNTPAPNKGDIDGQKSPVDPEMKDNDKGGFPVKKTAGDAHGDHVMENEEIEGGKEMEMSEDWVTEEDVQDEDKIEEQIPKGQSDSRRVPGQANIGQPRGTGAVDIKKESKESQYEKLLKEAKELKEENEAFKNGLTEVKKRLYETALFSTNLANVVKIFMEQSTTKDEKALIVQRFDEEVKSLKESNILYKKIVNELNSRNNIAEGVISKLDRNITSSKSELNEQTAYVDPSTERIRALMGKVNKVGK